MNKKELKKYELERLKKYCETYGVPTQSELAILSKKGILRSQSYYIYNFGSLKNTYELIGVKAERIKRFNISKEEALELLKKYCEKHKVPSSSEVEKNSKIMGICSYQYYKKHFGSWEKVLELIRKKSPVVRAEITKLSNEEILEKIKTWDVDFIYKNIDFLKYRFKTNIYGVYKIAGKGKKIKAKFLNRQDYIDIMKDIKDPVTMLEFDKKYASVSTRFMKFFGTWNNFLTECNREINFNVDPIGKTDNEIIEEYKKISIENGFYDGIPGYLFKKYFAYSSSSIILRFESMTKFKLLAGFDSKHSKYSPWNKEKLLHILSQKERMTMKKINKDEDLPSTTTIFRFFKTTSINKVYEEVEKYKKNKN